jgi:hypothetical protein
MSIISILTGWFFFLGKVANPRLDRSVHGHGTLVPFLPVLTVIGLYASIQFALPAVAEANRYLPMVIGLLGSIAVLQVMRPLKASDWKHVLVSPQIPKMLLSHPDGEHLRGLYRG